MKLYELTDDLRKIEEQIEMLVNSKDENAEEYIKSAKEIEETVRTLIQEKSESIVKLIRNWDSDIESIENEIKRLQEHKKSIEKKKDNLKNYTLNCLKDLKIKKIETALGNVSIRKGSGSVSIIDEDSISDEFKTKKIEIEIDKKLIRQKLKSGEIVEGAELIIKDSLILPK